METEHVYVVQPSDANVPLLADRWWISVAARVFPALVTTSKAKRERKATRLTLNGDATAATNTPVAVGDHIIYRPQEAVQRGGHSKRHTPEEWLVVCKRQGMRLVYENHAVAVIVKPVGIHVKGRGNRTVEYALPALLAHTPVDGTVLPHPHAMHRTDYRVGGLLLVAKTRSAEVSLANQFEQHRVVKQYRAILVGRLDPSAKPVLATRLPPNIHSDNVSWSMFVQPPEGDEKHQVFFYSTVLDGKPSCTAISVRYFTPSARYEWLTTVDLWPLTGRWHQLRLHMASLGHPIIGDDLHHDTPVALTDNLILPEVVRGAGLFLHAVSVEFEDDQGNRRSFEIPEPHKFDRFRHYCAINREKQRNRERRNVAEDHESADMEA